MEEDLEDYLKKEEEEEPAPPPEIGFYERYLIIIWIVIMFGVVPGLIFIIGSRQLPKTERQAPARSSSSPLSDREIQRLDKYYPEGYQVFEIVGDRMNFLKIGKLPEEFSFNNLQIGAKLGKQNDVRIYLPELYYPRGKISGSTVDATFPRQVNQPAILFANDTSQVVVEILEDTGNKLLCVLGVQIQSGK